MKRQLENGEELRTFIKDYVPSAYQRYLSDFLSFLTVNDSLLLAKAMVEKDYSHPSVIMYSLGNEVTETNTLSAAFLLLT